MTTTEAEASGRGRGDRRGGEDAARLSIMTAPGTQTRLAEVKWRQNRESRDMIGEKMRA